MHLASPKQVATGLCIALALCALAISTNPTASSARSSHSASSTAPLKVGLILDDPPNDQGWGTTWINAAHQVQHHFGRRVDLTWQFSIPDPNTGQAINALIQQGYKVIVTTTFGQQQAALQAAAQNPQVTFLATEAISTRPNLSTVDALQTDGYYVAGMAAAATRKGDTNGLVAAFPVPIYLADANAYQLGAASINPAAKTRIVGSSPYSPDHDGSASLLRYRALDALDEVVRGLQLAIGRDLAGGDHDLPGLVGDRTGEHVHAAALQRRQLLRDLSLVRSRDRSVRTTPWRQLDPAVLEGQQV